MDALSQFIQLTRPQASLDLRCLFQGPFSIPHDPEPEGQVIFHLVLAGTCLVETGGRTLTLHEGDFILFPRGHAHTIHDPASAANAPVRRPRASHDGMLPLQRTGRGAAEVDLLCGRFVPMEAAQAGFVGHPLGMGIGGVEEVLRELRRDRLTRADFQILVAGRHATADIEAAPVDATQFPCPGAAGVGARRAGETGHARDRQARHRRVVRFVRIL